MSSFFNLEPLHACDMFLDLASNSKKLLKTRVSGDTERLSASGSSVISLQPRLFPPEGGFLPYSKEIISMKVSGANAVPAFFPFFRKCEVI